MVVSLRSGNQDINDIVDEYRDSLLVRLQGIVPARRKGHITMAYQFLDYVGSHIGDSLEQIVTSDAYRDFAPDNHGLFNAQRVRTFGDKFTKHDVPPRGLLAGDWQVESATIARDQFKQKLLVEYNKRKRGLAKTAIERLRAKFEPTNEADDLMKLAHELYLPHNYFNDVMRRTGELAAVLFAEVDDHLQDFLQLSPEKRAALLQKRPNFLLDLKKQIQDLEQVFERRLDDIFNDRQLAASIDETVPQGLTPSQRLYPEQWNWLNYGRISSALREGLNNKVLDGTTTKFTVTALPVPEDQKERNATTVPQQVEVKYGDTSITFKGNDATIALADLTNDPTGAVAKAYLYALQKAQPHVRNFRITIPSGATDIMPILNKAAESLHITLAFTAERPAAAARPAPRPGPTGTGARA